MNGKDKITKMNNMEIKVGDKVSISNYGIGIVSAIINHDGTDIYYIDLGKPIKFPCKREWIEPITEE